MGLKKLLIVFPLLFILGSFYSQSFFKRFRLTGTTVVIPSVAGNGCEGVRCFELTPNSNSKAGSVFNLTPLNLLYPFDLSLCVNLGSNDANGADGIAFVLKAPTSRYSGIVGGGLGAETIDTSVIIEFDTWNNGTIVNDIRLDHTALSLNGKLNNPLISPIVLGGGNIEDGKDHKVRLTWNPLDTNLSMYFDDVFIFSYKSDIVSRVFYNDPLVEWGFTASTGGSKNRQTICYPDVKLDLGADVKVCDGDTAEFSFYKNNLSEYLWRKVGNSDTITYWSSNSGTPLVDTTLEIYTPGKYYLQVVQNTFIITDTIEVVYVKYAIPPLKDTLVEICKEEGAAILDAKNEGFSYLWKPLNYPRKILVTDSLGRHYVTITDTIINRCSIKDSAFITNYCPPSFKMPNVFTPNGDNKNDVLMPIESKYIKNFTMKLYDAWGNLIYETDKELKWDGRNLNGKDVSGGVYYYMLSYTDEKDFDRFFKERGYINLLR